MKPLAIAHVQRVSAERSRRWHPGGVTDWSAMEWSAATCGEAGEAANVAKKIKRIDDGMLVGIKSADADRAVLVERFGEELADTVLYAVLAAEREGIDLQDAIRRKFNSKSADLGFPERL